MSFSEKASAIKEVVSLVVNLLPKIVDVVLQVITSIREVKTV